MTPEQAIEHLLTFMTLCEESGKNGRQRYASSAKIFGIKNLGYFDGAQPLFGDEGWAEAHDALSTFYREDWAIPPPEHISARESWPIDIRLCHAVNADDPQQEKKLDVNESGFMLSRIRTLTAQEIRGRCYARYAAEVAVAHLQPDGSYFAAKSWHTSQTGTRPWALHRLNLAEPTMGDGATVPHSFLFNHRQDMRGEKDLDEEWKMIHLAMSIAFVRYYDWTVNLGYVGSPSLLFPTDPTGAMEAFRLRDIPNGKSRRDALRNWVTQHWRRPRRDDPEALIKVRQHLRGATRFTWNGLTCLITPSPDALATNTRLAREREDERRRGRAS